MNRKGDLIQRGFVLAAPILIPIVACYMALKIIIDGLYDIAKELLDCFLANVALVWKDSMIGNYFKALFNVFFDWDIGAVEKPRNERIQGCEKEEDENE